MKHSEAQWVEVCSIGDIPIRGSIKVEYGKRNIAIFRTADSHLGALEDKCPHKGGPLSDGIVHGNCVTCPLHNWDISLETGEAMGADIGQVKKYAVRQSDNKVFLKIAEEVVLALV